MRAGLIPSRALQERRIIHDRTQTNKNGEDGKSFIETRWCYGFFARLTAAFRCLVCLNNHSFIFRKNHVSFINYYEIFNLSTRS